MATANVVNTKVVFESTKEKPYYNDYNEDKNYVQVLFRPEYAVQARELTQLQTILQNQIERFGQHVFVNGSPVIGGLIDFEKVTTLNLSPTYANTDILHSDFASSYIQFPSNTDVQARVIQTSNSNANEPIGLYVKYQTGDEFATGDTIRVGSTNTYANIASTSNGISSGLVAYIHDSIYFVDGYFVKVPAQSVVTSKYTPSANAKIGLEKVKSIVDESSDSTLLDPAAEASNFDAPGATRAKFVLNLATRSLDSTDDDEFIELARIENGILQKLINKPVYSEIEEVLKRRTYDESGDYTVRPFILSLFDNDTTNTITSKISPGKAYIKGAEYETIAETVLSIPKAQTKASVTGHDLNMNYGNYVIVDNMQGLFDISNWEIADIHCVPYQNVSHASQAAYDNTKIGTTRVRDINFYSGDIDVTARKFEFYMSGTQFSNLTSNAASTSNADNQIVLGGTPSAIDDAYNGAILRVIDGVSVGDVRTILDYNGTTKTANVSSDFTTTPTSATRYRIEFDFGEAESFVKDTTYTSGASVAANTNINVLNKDNGLSNGQSFLFETNLNRLLFRYPKSYVANTVTNQSFFYRRVYDGVQFTNGNSAAIAAGTGEDFEGASASSNIASTVMDNFTIFVTDNQGGSRSNGEQIKVTTSITGTGPEQATFDTGGGSGDDFLASVLAKMQISGSSAAAKTKTMVLANTQTFTAETSANTFVSSTGATVDVYPNSGQVTIQNPSRTPDQRESLYLSDVHSIKTIYDLNGAAIPSSGADLTGYSNVASKFILDDGQRDNFYDHASIRLKPGSQPVLGPLIVCTRYYKHSSSEYGYFNVDSYPDLDTIVTEEGTNLGTGYALIPTHQTDLNKIYPLRDSIDFRPSRKNASNTSVNYTLQGIRVPIPATDFQSDYSYYLPRYDLIVLSPNKQLQRIQGIPSDFPQVPTYPDDSMVLYRLRVAPYTAYASNVVVRYIDNKRYTMKDIGLMDKRLKVVEYYSRLNTLEKKALDITITDVDGLDRTKYGVLADNFDSHRLGDTALPDYLVAIDNYGQLYGGVATPLRRTNAVQLQNDRSNDTNIKNHLNTIMLDYSVEQAISQPYATKSTVVAEYIFADFIGTIKTKPDSDIWKDVTFPPIIIDPDPPICPPLPDPPPDEPTDPRPPIETSVNNHWFEREGDGPTDNDHDGGYDTGPGNMGDPNDSDPSDGGRQGGGGGDGGGGTVICTLLSDRGFLTKEIWKLDDEFGAKLREQDSTIYRGYLIWAQPVVNYVRAEKPGHAALLNIIKVIAKPWAEYMAHEMQPTKYKSNHLGMLLHYIGGGISYLIGKTKEWMS